MNKVAIISCYFQPNYGSMLQAYATQEILNKLDIPNETINIEGLQKEIHDSKMKYFRKRMFSKDVIKDKLGFIKLTFEKKINKKLGNDISTRNNCFKKFSNKYFNISKKYSSIAELGKQSVNYSAFLVGSDQLWLPSNIAADYYTLSYVHDSVRRIAYATSFGVSELPEKQAEMAKQFIPKINFLSVREKSGQKLIKNLTGLDAELVCDPTLLMQKEDWKNLIKPKKIFDEKYIFCYFLGDNCLSRKCAKKLSKITGYKIVALQQLDMYIKSDSDFADYAPYNIDPADFVNLIANAEFICTDSFHGTVFSLINHKNFFSFRRFTQKTSMSTNSRIDSLLEILNLSDRIIDSENDFDLKIRSDLDYSQIDSELENFRNKSLEFLKNSLKGLNND